MYILYEYEYYYDISFILDLVNTRTNEMET